MRDKSKCEREREVANNLHEQASRNNLSAQPAPTWFIRRSASDKQCRSVIIAGGFEPGNHRTSQAGKQFDEAVVLSSARDHDHALAANGPRHLRLAHHCATSRYRWLPALAGPPRPRIPLPRPRRPRHRLRPYLLAPKENQRLNRPGRTATRHQGGRRVNLARHLHRL